jgi:CDP-glucose 4,6-dehydratase
MIRNNEPLIDNIVIGDLTNLETVRRSMDQYEIDTCFHLGAQAIVSTATQSPTTTFESNIKGTWNVLEASRVSSSVQRIVVASSDKAYGEPIELPITEQHPLLASHPYDASKACSEILARSYFSTYGLPIAIARCCNIYGGGDLNFSRIVPDTIRSLLLEERPMIRTDGTAVRDYMYISDAVSGYLSLADNLDRSEVKGQALNFSAGNPLSVVDLVEKIAQKSGRAHLKPVIAGKNPKNEIGVQYLSAEKAEKILSWEARVPLDEGISSTIKWYEEHKPLWDDPKRLHQL